MKLSHAMAPLMLAFVAAACSDSTGPADSTDLRGPSLALVTPILIEFWETGLVRRFPTLMLVTAVILGICFGVIVLVTSATGWVQWSA